VIANFVPVFISRGVVQVSAYIDALLASLLPSGAVSGLFNAQILYTLPVSLFGMSVSAAELPVMSSALGDQSQIADYLRRRLNVGLRQIAFFVVPSAMGFLALGDVISGALLQTGRLTHRDVIYIWGILAGSAVGLLASTLGRLYSSTYYAMRDTRTPLRYAIVRVAVTTGLGWVFAFYLPRLVGIEARWGAAGLTASAGLAGWLEFSLLRRTLNRRIGKTGLPSSFVAQLWLAAGTGALLAWAVKLAVGLRHPVFAAVLILGPYGVAYLGVTYLAGMEECRSLLGRGFGLLRTGRMSS
jgi:putative peptidoglycan lipid II flippase